MDRRQWLRATGSWAALALISPKDLFSGRMLDGGLQDAKSEKIQRRLLVFVDRGKAKGFYVDVNLKLMDMISGKPNEVLYSSNAVVSHKKARCDFIGLQILPGAHDRQPIEQAKKLEYKEIMRLQEIEIIGIADIIIGLDKNNPTNWARIAASIVQNIPKDEQKEKKKAAEDAARKSYLAMARAQLEARFRGASRAKGANPDMAVVHQRDSESLVEELLSLEGKSVRHRFPYEVVGNGKGSGFERDMLLAAILAKLGFGAAIFVFEEMNVTAVGVRCEEKFRFADTGYAIIDASGPAIITDKYRLYNGQRLPQTPDATIVIATGRKLGGIGRELQDAKRLHALELKILDGQKLTGAEAMEQETLLKNYGIRTEIELMFPK